MKRDELLKYLVAVADDFDRQAREELDARWKAWKLDLAQNEVHEVIGALLGRQVTLAVQLAGAMPIWTPDSAPVALRAMADVYINLAWIFGDPLERSRKFISFGLGQMKLETEHRRAQLEADGRNPEKDLIVGASEAWINSQRWTFLTQVNLGAWSETSTRTMAEEASCIDFYNYVYAPFSAASHSMWHHVSRFNLLQCTNPLHRFHSVPVVPRSEIDPHYLFLAGKYLDKCFRLFDEKTGVKTAAVSAFDTLSDALKKLREKADGSAV
jgi:hypothetical protein